MLQVELSRGESANRGKDLSITFYLHLFINEHGAWVCKCAGRCFTMRELENLQNRMPNGFVKESLLSWGSYSLSYMVNFLLNNFCPSLIKTDLEASSYMQTTVQTNFPMWSFLGILFHFGLISAKNSDMWLMLCNNVILLQIYLLFLINSFTYSLGISYCVFISYSLPTPSFPLTSPYPAPIPLHPNLMFSFKKNNSQSPISVAHIHGMKPANGTWSTNQGHPLNKTGYPLRAIFNYPQILRQGEGLTAPPTSLLFNFIFKYWLYKIYLFFLKI